MVEAMSLAIGDLVQVVKTCKCEKSSRILGCIGRISSIETLRLLPGFSYRCYFCLDDNSFPRSESLCYSIKDLDANVLPRNWLRKIPPMEELEGKTQKEDIPVKIPYDFVDRRRVRV